MKRYRLTLTDEQTGQLLDSWILSDDPADDAADFRVPLHNLSELTFEINSAVARSKEG